MINSREYTFMYSVFNKTENHQLFSKIKQVYQDDLPQFFECLVLYNFTYSEKFQFRVDDQAVNDSIELFEKNKEQFIELLHYNSELKIHSELLDVILDKEQSNYIELVTVSDIKQALKEIERKNLKESFKELDEVQFLSVNEIVFGFKNIQRKIFKESFKELDRQDFKNKPVININFIQLSKYAAILLMIMSFAYFFINIKLSSSETQTSDKNHSKNEVKNTQIPYSPLDIDIASGFSSKQSVLQIPLLGSGNSNSSFSNTIKPVEEFEIDLTISHLDLRKSKQLLTILTHQLKDYPDHKVEINSKIANLKKQSSTHNNTYIFTNQKCILKLNEVFDSKSINNYKIVCLTNGFIKHYYLKYINTYFELKESTISSALNEIKDENILKNLISIK